ncbi:uncharacterized protein JCM15063_005215 [Sporobolomyces koalae]|uniref:uncharacterized protein n=1 Tax=Sporobolomyces koalae TaxID=500713 RepID=UPI003176D06D
MMGLDLIHLPLIGYFGAIAGLLAVVYPGISQRTQTRGSFFFLALAVVSLTATWTYMGLYFQHSFREAAADRGIASASFSTREWLNDVSLFKQAWGYVCDTAERYWWSEQLMYWTTGPLTILMSIEGRRLGIKHLWAYMLIGQLVAVSFAQSLFFAAITLAPRVLPQAPVGRPLGPPAGQSWTLVASVVSGAIGTALVPARVSTDKFLPLLLAVHTFAILPLLEALPQPRVRLPPSRFYFNYAFIALRLRWDTISQLVDVTKLTAAPKRIPAVFSGLLVREWHVLNEHPAQSSISWDVIFASLTAMAFMWWDNATQSEAELKVPYELVTLFTVSTPIVGIQSSIGMYLAIREGKRESMEQKLLHDREDDKEKKEE